MKTTIEKIKESSVAAMVLCAIAALLMAVTAICYIIDSDPVTAAAEVADSVCMVAVAITAMLMFKRFSDSGKPFSVENVKYLRIIALILMAGGVVVPLTKAIAQAVTDIQVTFRLNTWMIFFGAILNILVQIFIYGTMLQQESDETI